jgi:hypothetical protein
MTCLVSFKKYLCEVLVSNQEGKCETAQSVTQDPLDGRLLNNDLWPVPLLYTR